MKSRFENHKYLGFLLEEFTGIIYREQGSRSLHRPIPSKQARQGLSKITIGLRASSVDVIVEESPTYSKVQALPNCYPVKGKTLLPQLHVQNPITNLPRHSLRPLFCLTFMTLLA